MLGPKNPLLLTIIAGLTNGTVSAMKCAVVIAPYSRWANTATVRIAISRWISPPGRNRSAMHTAPARSPRTVTDADDGENGPGSASDRLVARKVGNAGRSGCRIRRYPLLPRRIGLDAVGARRVDRGQVLDVRQPPRQRYHPLAHGNPAAHRQREVFDTFVGFHAGRNPHRSPSRDVSMSGAPCTSSQLGAAVEAQPRDRRRRRPSAAAICRKRQRARRGEIDRPAVNFGIQDARGRTAEARRRGGRPACGDRLIRRRERR